MGEVYRADDLTLDQAVALKFLPAALAHDERLLEMLHAEVRNARQVSHPNVCRVYDIGEVEGRHFYSMEYVDGEDLAALLRRIGRLSQDKGLEIAHQLCAGLNAAHESGLLHRDLKPANVMLDGRGRARITDFGLALPTAIAEGKSELAGTPAYMAPEQLEGGQASVRSDIYSLGLLLYEVFTGKRAFEAGSVNDWKRAHLESQPKIPSSLVGQLDPAIERAILRCLQKDPKLRPASALQVAASLPGGDPLAAALAAGETPSPEMVASAGAEAGISPRMAVLALVAFILIMIGSIPLAHRGELTGIAPMAKTPEALEDRAQQFAQQAGYKENVVDHYSWTEAAVNYLRYKAEHEPSPERVRGLRNAVPSPYLFHYLASPQPLAPLGSSPMISTENPPLTTPGMLSITLDGNGELRSLFIVPPRLESGPPASGTPDWEPLFRNAGLDISRFQPAQPRLVPPFASDARLAWEGENGGYKLHVDAASFHGSPVMFVVLYPWFTAGGTRSAQQQRSETAGILFQIFIVALVPGFCVFLARRNMRLGRGDVAGAWRVAIFVLFSFFASQSLWSYYPSHARSIFSTILENIGMGLLFAAISWVAYVAVEPMVRRTNPHMLVSWTRVLAGRFSDPLVGRDILLGVIAGVASTLVGGTENALPWWKNLAGEMPGSPPRQFLGTAAEATGTIFSYAWQAVLIALLFVFLFIGARLLLRNRWAAMAAVMVVLGFQDIVTSPRPLLTLAFSVPALLLLVLPIAFLGPLAAAVAFFAGSIVYRMAGMGVGAWYGTRSTAHVLLIVAVAVYGFRCAVAGRQLFGRAETDKRAARA